MISLIMSGLQMKKQTGIGIMSPYLRRILKQGGFRQNHHAPFDGHSVIFSHVLSDGNKKTARIW